MSANRRMVGAIGAALLFAAIAVLAAAPGRAQSHYPDHPVVLIVPYGPGGVADVGMRLLGDKLSTRLQQQFVIENRPGAAGIVGPKPVP